MMDEQILQLLRDHASTYLSGEEISRQLNVTRTAVWKKVNRLREVGYEIDASPRSGYRLVRSPNLLTPTEVQSVLKTEWLGKTIHHFYAIESTNVKAYQLALDGAEEGEVVIAESQEKGKGRLGRDWFSPPFSNLYLSVILRPDILPQKASLITLMAAVAVADAIQTFSDLVPLIKWPNDILLRGRKVAGLLNEIRSETDRIHFVILGIGINLNTDKKMFPKEIRAVATSLKQEMKGAVSRKVFLGKLLQLLEEWYGIFLKEGEGPILNAWKVRADIRGRLVKVTSFGEQLTGVAIDIDSDGALIMETTKGQRQRIVAGDIEYTNKAPNSIPNTK